MVKIGDTARVGRVCSGSRSARAPNCNRGTSKFESPPSCLCSAGSDAVYVGFQDRAWQQESQRGNDYLEL